MYYDLFFVASPIQLLSAINACEEVAGKENKKILVYRDCLDNKTAEQIESIINDNHNIWDSIYKINLSKNNKFMNLFGLLKMSLLFHYLFYLKCRCKIDNYFIGDYRYDLYLRVAKILKVKRIFILDDGIAAVSVTQNYLFTKSEMFHISSRKKKFRNYFLTFLGLGQSMLTFTFYSFLDLNSKVLMRKSLGFIKAKPLFLSESRIVEYQTDLAYILGAKFVELNYLSNESYFEYVKIIITRNPGYKFIYIPHRSEEENNYKLLNELSDLDVKEINEPIENFITKSNVNPALVVSFYSAALFTLPSIMIKTKFQSIVVNDGDWHVNSLQLESIKEAYNMLPDDCKRIYK